MQTTDQVVARLLQYGFSRAGDFVEQLPDDGAAPGSPTQAFLAYDDDNLHAVLVAADPDPRLIRAHMAPRENVGSDDVVTLILDADGDRRRAYAFRSNPLGIQWDALWTEGQGFDASYDAVWRSEGMMLADGYAVLFSIPFKTLRFNASSSVPWGVVFERSVPRGQGETSYWPRVSSEVQGTLTQAADLVGIRDVVPGRNLQGIGYANARRFRALDSRAAGGPIYVQDDLETEVGADVKAVLDDRFVMDFTVNPDFSQVESDQPQVSVNRRFELFFPERRPFFTENADYFQTPINLLFTRRIADPRLGSRFTGRAGPWGLGGLLIDDEAPGRLAPLGDPRVGRRATFSAVRVARDLGESSRLGGIYVGRDFLDDSNRVFGLDARARLNDHWTGSAQVASSRSDGPDDQESGSGAMLSLSRSGRTVSYFGSVQRFSEAFDPRAGFVTRTGVVRTSHFASYFHRPQNALLFWGPEVFVSRVWDVDGTLLDEITEASLEWRFVGGWYLEVNARAATDRLGPDDHPSLTAPQAFDVGLWDIEFGTSQWSWFQVAGNLRFGNQTNLRPVPGAVPTESNWTQLSLFTSTRPAVRLRIDNALIRTELSEPGSASRIFRDLIFRSRVNWQFTRELSVRAILQYEETQRDEALTSLDPGKNLNADFLVTYRLNPWTALYAGVNVNGQNLELLESSGGGRTLIRTDALSRDTHQFFVKGSYLLRF